MKRNGSGRPDPEDPEDIEILEVVGMSEDAPAPPAEDDVEVEFEDKSRRGDADAPTSTETSEEQSVRERLLRLQADFENLKRRVERERSDYYRHASGSLVARLLPVLDNFERAIVASRQGGSDEAFRSGIALIHKQLLDELKKEGLEAVQAMGLPFDPRLHEALATDPSSTAPANTVTEEVQRGYTFHDRLLRPALVRVSVAPVDEDSGADPAEES